MRLNRARCIHLVLLLCLVGCTQHGPPSASPAHTGDLQLAQVRAFQLASPIRPLGAAMRHDGRIAIWTSDAVMRTVPNGDVVQVDLDDVRPLAVAAGQGGWEILDSASTQILQVGLGGEILRRIDFSSRQPLLAAAKSGCGWLVHYRNDQKQPEIALVGQDGQRVWSAGLSDLRLGDTAEDMYAAVILGGTNESVYVVQRDPPFRLARVSCSGQLDLLPTNTVTMDKGRWLAVGIASTGLGLFITYGDFTSDRRVIRRVLDYGYSRDLAIDVPLAILSGAGDELIAIRRTDRTEIVVYRATP